MARNRTIRWLVSAAVASLVLVRLATGQQPTSAPAQPLSLPNNASPAAANPAADGLLRHVRNVPGDSKPITISADEVVTWVENGRQVVLARGGVLVLQSVLQLRCQKVVAWVDLGQLRQSGIMTADLYAEGQVRLDTSTKIEDGDRAVVKLTTRNGAMSLRSYRRKVSQQPAADDTLVVRARGLIGAPNAPVVLPAAASSPAPANPLLTPLPVTPPARSPQQPASGGVRTMNYFQPAPLPVPPAPPAPDSSAFVPVAPAQPGSAPLPTPPLAAPPPTVGPRQPPVTAPAPALPGLPPLPGPPPTPLPPPTRIATPPRNPATFDGGSRQFSVAPRQNGRFNLKTENLPNGEQAIIIPDGVILNVRDVKGIGMLDMEADRVVIWVKNAGTQRLAENLQQPGSNSGRDLEFYLSGNVEIRQQEGKDNRTIRADEVYYDVNRNVAIATKARLEIKDPKLPVPFMVRTPELHQLAANQYQVVEAEIFASKLPSDPGLKVYVREATIEEVKVPQMSIFGTQTIDRRTGQQVVEEETRFVSRNVFFELEDVPFFYLPYLAGDARDPLGPLQNISFGYNRVFGAQLGLNWDLYELLGIQRYQGTRWRLETDYLSERGPGLGMRFDYAGKDFLGMPSHYQGLVRGYGIYDRGNDILGGPSYRNDYFTPPSGRGRFQWRQGIYELPDGFQVQSQISLLSDRNFLEQYYKPEFDRDINQNSFIYVKQQQEQFAWTGYLDKRFRSWVTETESLPRFDGWGIGLSLFDALTYSAHASAGYLQLKPTTDNYPSNAALGAPRPVYPNPNDIRNFFPRVSATDVANNTFRFDFFQELSLPFNVGALRVVPYGKLALTEYTDDLQGQEIGRVWGGGGVRGSLPFSRLYRETQNDLFNVNGIYHKVTLGGNYFIGAANEPFNRFAQLDRFNDDASDQSVRDIRAAYPAFYGPNGQFLATSNLFDPQYYAIRRALDNRVDTLDEIQVLQFDILQRWQTKRGYPGAQHIIDWMVLDLSGSYFPAADRDNFGSSFAFLEYDYLWNIGDRTAVTSRGWYDPIEGGARVFDASLYFSRPDRTMFQLGFRYTDPLESRVVNGSVTYVFSPKYAMTASVSYDFGTNQSQANSISITRIGSDLQMTLGVQYNSLQNNLGFTFEIFPTLMPNRGRTLGVNSAQASGLASRR